MDILDIAGLTHDGGGTRPRPTGQPWLGIRFRCCEVYARVYRNPDATAYTGRCPRCLREVRLRVGPDGTNARFFVAE